MKRPLAALLAGLIMVGILWTGLRRPESSASNSGAGRPGVDRAGEPSGPDLSGATGRIESLLDAAGTGDLSSYLESFEGPFRARMERQAEERGRDAFAADLRRTAGARKSHAVFAPEAEPEGDPSLAARIVVDSTFTDRIERQTYHLVRRERAWRIIEVEIAREHLPEKPLGSLASFQEPEGVPVPADPRVGIPAGDAEPPEN